MREVGQRRRRGKRGKSAARLTCYGFYSQIWETQAVADKMHNSHPAAQKPWAPTTPSNCLQVRACSRSGRTNEPSGSGAAGEYVYDRGTSATAAGTTRPGSSRSQPTDANENRIDIAGEEQDIPARGTQGAGRT